LRLHIDKFTNILLGIFSLFSVIILFLILIFLIYQSAPVLSFSHLLNFFSSSAWHPLEGQLGLWPMLFATLITSVGALLLALPFGLAVAIYSEYITSGIAAKLIDLLVVILAGIPSVVFGLWGLTVIVPLINQWHPPGASLLAAIFILAIMIMPTIAITARSALAAIPKHLTEAASSLALSQYTRIVKIFLPAAKQAIRQGSLLALVRALGETMAVLMVAGNVVQIPYSIFDPVRVLTANIALEMAYATDQHRAALFASGLLLMILVCISLWCAKTSTKTYAN
jgi:phosphate transport system permease protein